MKARARRRRTGGFLLIEVLISLLLLVVCAAGTLALLGSVFFSTSFAGTLQTASRLGQQVIDQAMLEPFANIGGPGSACQISETVYATGAAVSSGPGDTVPYTRTCTVGVVGSGVGVGMKVIQVAVSFNDAQNRAHTVRMGMMRAP